MMKQKGNTSFIAPCRKSTRKESEEDKEGATETEEEGRQLEKRGEELSGCWKCDIKRSENGRGILPAGVKQNTEVGSHAATLEPEGSSGA